MKKSSVKQFVTLICVLLMIPFAVSACGSPASDIGIAAAATGDPKDLDLLTVAVPALPSTRSLDPNNALSNAGLVFYDSVFDTLLSYDDAGELKGELAESWEWIDEYTLEMKLKEGIVFHNGDPFTAEDVKFTFERTQTLFGGGLTGSLVAAVESVELVDEYTVRFTNANIDISFVDRLATEYGIQMVPKKYIEEVGEEAFQLKPIGTGPFYYDSISPESIVLERFDGFWGAAPHIKTIRFIMLAEDSARLTALANHEADLITNVATDLRNAVNELEGARLVEVPVNLFHFLMFNTAGEGPISNKDFRHALAHAIDRDQLVEAFWGSGAYAPNGLQLESYGDMYLEDYDGITYDVDLAKEYLARSGYNGEEIVINISPDYYPSSEESCETIVSMWREIGVNARFVPVEGWDGNNIKDVSMWSGAPRFNNHAGLFSFYEDNAYIKGAIWPDMPQAYIDALHRIPTLQDLDERRESAREMMSIFDEWLPAIPLYVTENYYGIRDGLHWEPERGYEMIVPLRAEDFWAE